jgi:hypothetical protein
MRVLSSSPNNPVQHARTKHIDVRHHFIRDHQQKGDIWIESVGTEDQLAHIFTKPMDEKRFCKLRNELNILDFSNMCWCTTHLYDVPLLRASQGKNWLACIHPLLRTCLVHLVIPHVLCAYSWKLNEFDACMVLLLLLRLTWSSGSIWHVCGLVNLVFDLENEIQVFNSIWYKITLIWRCEEVCP